MELYPIVENELPLEGVFVRVGKDKRHIFVSTSFARDHYRIVPHLRNPDNPHVVFYVAYNTRAERTEFAIGPEMLDTFISKVSVFAIAAGNFSIHGKRQTL